MKITFANTRLDLYPPLGLCYLSSYLKKHLPEIEIRLVEPVRAVAGGDDIKKVLDTQPDVVGFITYTVNYHEVLECCRRLKDRRPDLPIMLGGPHITSLPHTLPPEADLAVLGEGEATLLELSRIMKKTGRLGAEDLERVPGICYRAGRELRLTPPGDMIADLDSIPPPDLSILNMEYYTALKRFMVLDGYFRGFVLLSSRGCHYRCRFCQASAHWGNCRYHTARRVVDEIESLKNRYPRLNAVNVVDDLFIGDRKRLRDIVGLIRERRLHEEIAFNVNGHVNMISEEVLDLLKSMNVIQIGFGFESGSERILDFLKRGAVKLKKNHQAAELTNRYGIGVGGQFMAGCPGETEDDLRQTIDFIRNTKMSHAHLSVTTPLPGTALWDICAAKGLVSDSMDWRRLDFANPDNPDLLYCNEEGIPKERFRELLRDARRVSDSWNPRPSRINDLLNEGATARVYGYAWLASLMAARIRKLPGRVWRKFVRRIG